VDFLEIKHPIDLIYCAHQLNKSMRESDGQGPCE